MNTSVFNKITKTRWFPLFDVGCVAVSGAIWYVWEGVGAWPALLALLPWAVRLFAGQFPFRRTAFDLLFLIFMGTALVGVWAAYDPAAAWPKFWLLLAGVLLFYAVAGQPSENWLHLYALLGAFSTGVAGYYFLTHNWEASPAKIEVLNNMGLVWMRLRPALTGHVLHPNVAAGLMATTLPFLVVVFLVGVRKKVTAVAGLAAAALALVGFALLMTTSRGAWLAAAGAFSLWGVWQLSGVLSRRLKMARQQTFGVIFSVLLLGLLLLIFLVPGGLLGLLNRLPGPAQAGSRLDLAQALFFLTGDTPFTGGGLDAFPGLYSQYILGIPSFRLDHGHNLFLDVALEQGVLGSLLMITILFGTGWRAFRSISAGQSSGSSREIFVWGALASLLILMAHGVFDDVLYGSRAPFMIFLPAGAAVSVGRSRRSRPVEQEAVPLRTRAWMLLLTVVLAGGFLFVFRRPFQAAWYANLGAVHMARVELAEWPTDEWDRGERVGELQPARDLFYRVLVEQPRNLTALYRLGLIAMLERDYGQAVVYLETAHQLAEDHPGIRKSLAYSYIWAGREADALALLSAVEEAPEELGIYTWWWKTQGREDLSQYAASAAARLSEIQP
jgi:putative inorganic carbon (HCO3(-)) transporter